MANTALVPVDPTRLMYNLPDNIFPAGMKARFLAQGDSWFSIGAIPPGLTGNIIQSISLSQPCAVVNCARPGKILQSMMDNMKDPMFVTLLSDPKFSVEFDAILISGGGNDVIDAAGVLPGQVDPVYQPLFLDVAARGGVKVAPAAYLNQPGWADLAGKLTATFNQLIADRDKSVNKNKPLFLHSYAYCMPRPAGAVPGFGPWLYPAMNAYAIDPSDQLAVSKLLMDHMATLYTDLIKAKMTADPQCNIYLIDTCKDVPLVLADPKSTGDSNDWINEIHPNYSGYGKLGAAWSAALEKIL